MFKRILKIVGFVVLGFVLIIGAVLGFMAIRGDFKQKVIPPTALSFSVEKTELLFDVKSETESGEKVYSFTILAEPADVNQLACTVEPNYPSLIAFKDRVNGKWVDYTSSTFYINKPIYFVVKNVTEENVDDYYDGVLKFKVIDSSNMLNTTVSFEIDRVTTSIAFKDQGKLDNNKITNGLFVSDDGKYNGETVQYLEAVQGEAYPLEVITAPLKSNKPFASRPAKTKEIFYMEQGEPEMVVYNEEENKVKLAFYGNQGLEYKDCEFLTYDKESSQFIFNSSYSGKFEFKLATYATYEIQQYIEAQALEQGLSFVDRLNLNDSVYKMLTKTVEITVSGTDAQNIEFEGNVNSIGLRLLKDNPVYINNSSDIEKYNLGLTLSKAVSGTLITGRYNELAFINDDSFCREINWSFKVAKTISNDEQNLVLDLDGMDNVQYEQKRLGIELYYNEFGKSMARVTNHPYIDYDGEYSASLIFSGGYVLNLIAEDKSHTIQIAFDVDDKTNKSLSMTTDSIETDSANVEEIVGKLSKIVTINENGDTISECYVDTVGSGKMVLDGLVDGSDDQYNFKFLKSFRVSNYGGMYLAILGQKEESGLYTLINDKFITDIDVVYNLDNEFDVNSQINIKPIKGELDAYKDIQIYAAVVNSDGSCFYTINGKRIIVSKEKTNVAICENAEYELPIKVTEDNLIYSVGEEDRGIDVSEFAWPSSTEVGSYNQVVLFVGADTFVPLTGDNTSWAGLDVYIKNEDGVYTKVTDYAAEGTYYTSTLKIVENIIIVRTTGTGDDEVKEYFYLVGYISGGDFVNKVQAIGKTDGIKLYPVVLETEFDKENNRLQTAKEYIPDLLELKTTNPNTTFESQFINNPITLSNRFELDDSFKINGSFAGTYFSELLGREPYYSNNDTPEDKLDDKYYVIPGHAEIDLKWDGSNANNNDDGYEVVSKGSMEAVFEFTHNKAIEFAPDLFKEIEIVPTRYSKNNDTAIADLAEGIDVRGTIGTDNYEIGDDGEFRAGWFFTVDEDITLAEDEYIRFEWRYRGKTIAITPKIVLRSRELTGYEIYVNSTPYDQDALAEYSIEVKIGYNEGYTYDIALTNGTDEISIATGLETTDTLFKLLSDNGIVRPIPFYANNSEFDVTASSNIQLGDNGNILFARSSESETFTITNRHNKEMKLSLNAKVIADEFDFNVSKATPNGDDKFVANESSKTYTISNAYSYTGGDITDALDISIISDKISIGNFTSDYKVVKGDGINTYDKIVSKSNATEVLVEITKGTDDFGNPIWNITRDKLSKMTIPLNIVTVLGDYELTINYTSPYELDKNYNNPTTTIYSGTKFNIATSKPTENSMVLWRFTLNGENDEQNTDRTFRIKSANGIDFGRTDDAYKGVDEYGVEYLKASNGVWQFTVADKKELTTATFEVLYVENGKEVEKAGTITLNIAPNMFIKDRINEIYVRDDYTNNTYDLSEFAVYSYPTTKSYDQYDVNTLTESDKTASTINYTPTTYIDEDCTQEYGVNIAEVESNSNSTTLNIISPISVDGTYYVKVEISSVTDDDYKVIIGYIKFKVTTESDVVGNNGEKVKDITITSNGTAGLEQEGNTLDLDDLRNKFHLYRGAEDSGYNLTDIFWMDYADEVLEVEYIYYSATIIQKGNTLTYNASDYTLVNNAPTYVKDGLNNDLYVHIFSNGDEYVALAIDRTGGKKLYSVTYDEDAKTFALENLTETFGDLVSIKFKYNDFAIPDSSHESITIEYGAEMVFGSVVIVDSSVVIVNSNKYAINIKPYIIDANIPRDGIKSAVDYVLYNSGTGALDTDLFYIKNNDNIKSIRFEVLDDKCVVTNTGDVTKIQFKPNGNSYSVDILVILTYQNDVEYEYTVSFNVENSTTVDITYPHIVEEADGNVYNSFTTELEQLTRALSGYSIQEIYDDYRVCAKTNNSDVVQHDIAMAGDKINLGELTVVSSGNGVGDIELVAVSSSYDTTSYIQNYVICSNGTIEFLNTLPYTGYMLFKVYAKDSGAYNSETATYEPGTGAYGYYFVKVVKDTRFDNVKTNEGRNTKPLPVIVTTTNRPTIRNKITNEVISEASQNINPDLITQVYMFVAEDNTVLTGYKVKGDYVPNKTLLPPAGTEISTVKVAVVVEYETSLVHVCNIELILQPNAKVSIDYTKVSTETSITSIDEDDPDRFIYQADVKYIRDVDSKAISVDLFTVEDSEGQAYSLHSTEFATDKDMSDGIVMTAGNSGTIKLSDTPIGSIDNKQLVLDKAVSKDIYFYLKLTYEQVTDEQDTTNICVIYLKVTIKAFNVDTSVTTAEVGKTFSEGTNFNNKFDATDLFNGYKGGYKYWIDDGTEKTGSYTTYTTDDKPEISFDPVYEFTTKTLRIKFTDVVSPIEPVVKVDVYPNIKVVQGAKGYRDENALAELSLVDNSTPTLAGSQLTVDWRIGGNVITIKNGDDTYLTITVGTGWSGITFSLADWDNNALTGNYFVRGETEASSVTMEAGGGVLQFVHSASDLKLRLNIILTADTGETSVTDPIYIKLPKTYELTTAYRVNGAEFETMVENSSLKFNYVADEQSIKSHFLGNDASQGRYGSATINKTRLGLKIGAGELIYGYDNFTAIGLLGDPQKKNPNRLQYMISTNAGGQQIIENYVEFSLSNPEPVLSIYNDTSSANLQYKFKVFSAQMDYGKFTPDSSLLITKDEVNNKTYISVTKEELTSNAFVLGTLNYYPMGEQGFVGYIYTDTNVEDEVLVLGFEDSGYGANVKHTGNTLDSRVYNIEVKIITMNGIAAEYTLIVADVEILPGYGVNGYESAFAGGDIGKLSDKLPDRVSGGTRLTIKVNGAEQTIVPSGQEGVSLTYKGAFDGHGAFDGTFDYSDDNKDLIYYEEGVIKARSVDKYGADVTMVFDVTYTDNGKSSIVGRVLYRIRLINNLELIYTDGTINGAVDLYLGTDGYVKNDPKTTIDLLSNVNNNLYIKLYRRTYRNGEIVSEEVVLDEGNFRSHLNLVISEDTGFDSEDKDIVAGLAADGKQNGTLVITGNPAGTFVLNVSSVNGTGYGIAIRVTVHKYDQTTAKYQNNLNQGSGTGWESGKKINLFVTGTTNMTDYAFESNVIGYTKESGKHSTTTTTHTTSNNGLSIERKVFDSTTSLNDIKDESMWESGTKTINVDKTTIPDTLPQVAANVAYQIVAYRLKVTYHGTDDYYYAFYKVSNPNRIEVNDAYASNKTIVFDKPITPNGTDKTWTAVEGSSKDKLIIMGDSANNYGMYKFNSNSFLQTEDVTDDNEYSVVVTYINDSGSKSTVNALLTRETGATHKDGDTDVQEYLVYLEFPDNITTPLFSNSSIITISITNGAETLLTDTWTLKANGSVDTGDQGVALDKFFLRSEIADQKYHNTKIIGIMKATPTTNNVNSFVTNATANSVEEKSGVLPSYSGYSLWAVDYEGDISSAICSITETHYILVGKDSAMSLDLTEDYINLTIDDNNITSNNATINIYDYVKIHNKDNLKTGDKAANGTINVEFESGEVSYNSGIITLSNVHKLTQNKSYKAVIKYSGTTEISRNVELYFNIIIKPKSDDSIFDSNNGTLKFVKDVEDAITLSGSTTLTVEQVNANIALKKTLLSLITSNGKAVDTSNNNLVGAYAISVKDIDVNYSIEYNYTVGNITYTRTLTMSKY